MGHRLARQRTNHTNRTQLIIITQPTQHLLPTSEKPTSKSNVIVFLRKYRKNTKRYLRRTGRTTYADVFRGSLRSTKNIQDTSCCDIDIVTCVDYRRLRAYVRAERTSYIHDEN